MNLKILKLKILIKQGLNPRCVSLKDRREIPLFPAQFLLNPTETEKQFNYRTFKCAFRKFSYLGLFSKYCQRYKE
jgi:hypothetical protein